MKFISKGCFTLRVRKVTLAISILSLAFISTLIITLTYYAAKIRNREINCNIQTTNEQKKFKFLVKSIDGHINIFDVSNLTTPKMILDKPTVFLPEYDQKILTKGLYINDDCELDSLIEDYDD